MSPSTADAIIALADHIDEFADQLETLVTAGPYVWFRSADNTFHSTTEPTAPQAGDLYLFNATPGWQAQFPNWEAAAESLITVLAEAMDQPII